MARSKSKSVEDYIIDFSKEVKGSGGGVRVKEGTYPVRIVAAKPVTSAKKESPGLRVTFLITGGKYKKKKIIDTLWASPKAYSRFRALLEACGKKIPTKINLLKIAQAIKSEDLFIEVEDEKSEGYKTKSRVSFEGFISVDDYEEDEDDDDDDDDEDDNDDDNDDDGDDGDEDDDNLDEDDEDEKDDDEDDEDDDEDDDEEPVKKKRRKKKAPAKKGKAKKKRRAADDDDEDEDLEELDLDEL